MTSGSGSELDESLGSIASHARVALLVGVLGLFLGLPVVKSSYTNGRLVDCSSFNLVKLALGALAIGLGLLTIVRRDEYSSRAELAIGLIAVVLGAIAVLVSVGLVGTACEPFS